MSVYTIKAEPIPVPQRLGLSVEPIRIAQSKVLAEGRVLVKISRDVVGNGLYELGNNFPYDFDGGAIQI